ncbi:preprotein translocase subunit SecE [Mycolicibacterium sp.]|uniref:preprotein translocase subunit SecE n=1 Tax=Mycolicibacterium sp. TaxID=2320850 RepID=UPI003D0D8CE0
MSDEREGAGSADTGADTDSGDTGGQTAVVTRPLRPTGKRSRRAVEADDAAAEPQTDSADAKDGGDTKGRKRAKTGKAAKKPKDGPSRNPILFVINYLREVVGELRKVIWPNRKQMVSYTTVVLLFLAFMVALIGLTDLGLAKLVMVVFG